MKSAHHELIQCLFNRKEQTRKELANMTGLSQNHVNVLVSKLIKQRIIIETEVSEKNLGRPAAHISLNPKMAHVIGLDIGLNETRALITDVNGNTVASVKRATVIVDDRERIVAEIIDILHEICNKANLELSSIAGVGISVLGIVDISEGKVLAWTNKPAWESAWENFELSHDLQARIGIDPIVLDNTVRTMAVNVHRFGPAKEVDNFLYMFLGSNIGSSLMINGVPYAGSKGISGELGHVIVDEEGAWCRCGNRGCLEVSASTPAILERARIRLDELQNNSSLKDRLRENSITLENIIEAANAKDKLAFQIINETGAMVGKVLAFALNLLGVEHVVLGGPLAKDSQVLLNSIQYQVDARTLQFIAKKIHFSIDSYDEFSGTRGAALIVLEKIFNDEMLLNRLI